MDQLTDFERAAIIKIIETDLGGNAEYLNQLDGMIVTKREFTGVGLFVDVRPRGVCLPAEPVRRKVVSTGVHFKVRGEPEPFGMLLFIEDGLITLLECFSYEDRFPTEIREFNFFQGRSDDPPRHLRTEEGAIIVAMLAGTAYASRFTPLDPSLTVDEMNDGGMGSLRFVTNRARDARFGKQIAEAEYTDSDGVPVLITINIDKHGDLFELDVWKVDYRPLKRWPKPEDLRPHEINRPAT